MQEKKNGNNCCVIAMSMQIISFSFKMPSMWLTFYLINKLGELNCVFLYLLPSSDSSKKLKQGKLFNV